MDIIVLLQQEQILSHDFVHYHFQLILEMGQVVLSRYHVAKTQILKHHFLRLVAKWKETLLMP